MRRSSMPVLLAAAVYVLLTVALTWPLAISPRSIVPNDPGDPLLNTWIMAWNARTVPLTSTWWNAPQFFPIEGATAYTEHLLGLAPISSPVIWITGDHLLAYNVSFFLSFVLSGLAAYYLVFVITRRHDAAFLAGLAFMLSPYRMAQLPHIQVVSTYWMPLCLAGLHQYLQAPQRRARWLALAAGAWMMQALVCGYYLFFLSVLVGLWILWFVLRRDRIRDLPAIATAFIGAAVLMSPVLYGYWRISRRYDLRRIREEIEAFSADMASLFNASPDILAWDWLRVYARPEGELFPGATVVVLSAIAVALAWRAAAREGGRYHRLAGLLLGVGLVTLGIVVARFIYGPFRLEIGGIRLLSVTMPHKPLTVALVCLGLVALMHPAVRTAWRNRSPLAFYALAVIAMWLLSLGPAPTMLGNVALYKAPYSWLLLLPGADGIRVPARFWMLGVLCLATCAGLGLHYVGWRWPHVRRPLLAAAAAGILIDGWIDLRYSLRPDERPNHARAAMRLDLPLGRVDTVSLYRAASHHRPLVNGYSGYFAAHYWAVEQLSRARDPELLARIGEHGSIEVSIDHVEDDDRRFRDMVESVEGAELVYTGETYSSYRVPARPDRVPALEGPTVRVSSATSRLKPEALAAMFDGDRFSRWDAGRPQEPGDAMQIDLGAPARIRGVTMFIGGYSADFPRRLVVESSLDGESWSQVYTGSGGALAITGALRDPLNLPLDIFLPEHDARFVRFTQLGSDPVNFWSIAELRVVGGED